ncbi:MAG TPA: hypothetical protein VKX17_16845 [Planctomycetota bacterium]|nr:hypothetical protein [Planctomycetota bacterium]
MKRFLSPHGIRKRKVLDETPLKRSPADILGKTKKKWSRWQKEFIDHKSGVYRLKAQHKRSKNPTSGQGLFSARK